MPVRPILALGLIVAAACGQVPEQLVDWDLPRDLGERQRQLVELKLPPQVSRLEWIGSGIHHLDASGTAVHALARLPPELETLDLRDTGVERLAALPASLKTLDVRFTRVREVEDLPRSLVELKVGGDHLQALRLEGRLQALTIDDAPHLDLPPELPETLQAMTIVDSRFRNLALLPRGLKFLELRDTKVTNLLGLPDGLQSLVLIDNAKLRRGEPLPASLLALTVSGGGMPSLAGLEYLNHLAAPGKGWDGRPLRSLQITGGSALRPLPASLQSLFLAGADLRGLPHPPLRLPPMLERLDLRLSKLDTLPPLPPSLRFLDLSGAVVGDLTTRPAGLQKLRLEELRLEWYMHRRLPRLPASLRRLDLTGASLRALPRLHEGLQVLDLSESAVSRLPVLPATLRELDISNTPIHSLSQLPRGLTSLTSLTLHAGQVDTLEGMPPSVRTLRFVPAL